MLAGACAAVSLPLVLMVTRADMTHIAFVGIFGLIAIALLLAPLERWRWGERAATIAVSLVALTIFFGYAGKVAKTPKDPRPWKDYLAETAPTQWILQNVGPTETLFHTSHWGGLRYFHHRRSAVSFTMIPPQSFPGYFTESQWMKLRREIEERRPKALHTDRWRWGMLVTRRPKIAELYERKGDELYLLRTPVAPTAARRLIPGGRYGRVALNVA